MVWLQSEVTSVGKINEGVFPSLGNNPTCSDGIILYLDCGGSFKIQCISQNSQKRTNKNINFTVC